MTKDYTYTEVDGLVVADLFMLDKDTCNLSFFTKEVDNNNHVTTEVEYWLDDNTWHFIDNLYDEDGMFVNSCDTINLTNRGKEMCKEIITEFLSSININ